MHQSPFSLSLGPSLFFFFFFLWAPPVGFSAQLSTNFLNLYSRTGASMDPKETISYRNRALQVKKLYFQREHIYTIMMINQW